MPTYTYNNGENVTYNTEHYTILLQRDVSDAAGYLLKKISDDSAVDNILETECTACSNITIVDFKWPDFTYNGNNATASNWIMQNVIRHLNNTGKISVSHNADNTVYTSSINDGANVWTKNKA